MEQSETKNLSPRGLASSMLYKMARLTTFMTVLASVSSQVTCTPDVETSGGTFFEDCKVVDLNSAGMVGHVTNPNYPNLTYFSDRCWVIHMPPGVFVDNYIQVKLTDIDLNVPEDCMNAPTDFLELREGKSPASPLLGRWCAGWAAKEQMTSCTADLMVWLRRSAKSTERRGFSVSFTSVKKEYYDCYTRAPRVGRGPSLEDSVITAVAICLLLCVLVIVVIVIIKTKQRADDRDPRRDPGNQRDSWSHRRFENEAGAEEHGVPPLGDSTNGDRLHQMTEPSPSLSAQALSESLRVSKPLPIGIPRGAYRADGFPAGYASMCNLQEVNLHDVEVGFVADDHTLATREMPVEVHGAAVATEGRDVEAHNPLYELYVDSGLPTQPAADHLAVITQDTPLPVVVPATISGVDLGMALEEQLSSQGQGHGQSQGPQAKPELPLADTDGVTLSLSLRNDESFA